MKIHNLRNVLFPHKLNNKIQIQRSNFCSETTPKPLPSFNKLRLSNIVTNAIIESHAHIVEPTAIQHAAIPKILRRTNDVVIASQTGSKYLE